MRREILADEQACPRCRMPLGDSHLGACIDCGGLAQLGWEHLCRGCAGEDEVDELSEWEAGNEAAHDAWEWEQLRQQADERDAHLAAAAGEW